MRIKQHLDLSIYKLINVIIQHSNGKILQSRDTVGKLLVGLYATDKQDRRIRLLAYGTRGTRPVQL